jgi:arginine decarboxylase-like protein
VVVRPSAAAGSEIDLLDVVRDLRERGLITPLVLRFPEILAHRMGRLHDAFAAAIEAAGYRGRYLAGPWWRRSTATADATATVSRSAPSPSCWR